MTQNIFLNTFHDVIRRLACSWQPCLKEIKLANILLTLVFKGSRKVNVPILICFCFLR